MHGRTQHSSSAGPSSRLHAPAPLPEPTGPTDDRFVYHLEPKALQLLAEHGNGEELARPAVRTADVADAIEAEGTRQRRSRRTRDARHRGRRFASISYVTRGSQQLPLLRLSGKWLREAGFDLGCEYEIEISEGRLTLEAL